MNIYVGNLSQEVTETDLREAFEAFGEVSSVKIINDRYTGESRGFGFVEMPTKADGESAIGDLNDKELKGKTLNVNEARPRPQGHRSGGGRGGGGGGGGGGGRRSW
ncbi:MAG: RNA-binding protein [Deltaproteobacteria bacterium]|nr:RNA-binding protein [Deltaproteobacteria bacterium]